MFSTTCKGCGVTVSSESEDALVGAVQEHVGEAHGHRPSREQVLAVIRRRGDSSS